jgi:integrase/recombinase XerD
MATLKVILDERRKKGDNTYPIVIRLTHNQKSVSIPVEKSIKKELWDESRREIKKNHPLANEINLNISKKQILLEEKILRLGEIESFDVNQIKELITEEKKTFKSFIQFTENEIEALVQAGRIGSSIAYQCTLNSIKKHINNRDLSFKQITFQFLQDYQQAQLVKGLRQNAIAVYLRTLRALYNKAIKLKLADRTAYPFADFKIKTQKTANRAITKEDMTGMQNISLAKDSKINFYRDVFILIFNLIGISFSDLIALKRENINNGRVNYRRKKTGKLYSIKITTRAKAIFEKYRREDASYLLPILPERELPPVEEKLFIQQQLKNCNAYLKKIGKLCEINVVLTTYYARYSWANIAKSKGYSKDIIAEALGHEYGNKVTGIYLDNYPSELIDEVNEKVTK